MEELYGHPLFEGGSSGYKRQSYTWVEKMT